MVAIESDNISPKLKRNLYLNRMNEICSFFTHYLAMFYFFCIFATEFK